MHCEHIHVSSVLMNLLHCTILHPSDQRVSSPALVFCPRVHVHVIQPFHSSDIFFLYYLTKRCDMCHVYERIITTIYNKIKILKIADVLIHSPFVQCRSLNGAFVFIFRHNENERLWFAPRRRIRVLSETNMYFCRRSCEPSNQNRGRPNGDHQTLVLTLNTTGLSHGRL